MNSNEKEKNQETSKLDAFLQELSEKGIFSKSDIEKIKEQSITTYKHLSHEQQIEILKPKAALKEQQIKAIDEYGNDFENPYNLLYTKSRITGEDELISTCTVSKSSIHLHCGVSRDIVKDEYGNDLKDEKGQPLTNFKKKLQDLRKYYGENENTTPQQHKEILKKTFSEVIEPLIFKTMQECVKILEKYPHLENVRLDTNPGFFNFVYPALSQYGFKDTTNINELQELFGIDTIPEDRKKTAQIGRERLIEYVKNREQTERASIFTEQEIGKSTINTPTQEKDSASNQVQKDQQEQSKDFEK